jgi:hypothetical protein
VLGSFAYWLLCLFLALALVRTPAARAQTVDLLALRRDVRVLRRRAQPPRWRPGDRFLLAAVSRCLPRGAWWRFPVRSETPRRWHRELVRRTWAAGGQRRGPGRPPLVPELQALIRRRAREHPIWGDQRRRGDLRTLGHPVAASTIQALLRRHRVPAAPHRAGRRWSAFLRAQATGLLTCDIFTVETVRLQTVYVRFFLDVHARRVVVTGCTPHPTAAWVAQQARNGCWDLAEARIHPTVLLRDRDTTFVPACPRARVRRGVRR